MLVSCCFDDIDAVSSEEGDDVVDVWPFFFGFVFAAVCAGDCDAEGGDVFSLVIFSECLYCEEGCSDVGVREDLVVFVVLVRCVVVDDGGVF